MADFKVGKVTHYYDKIGVAVVELSSDLGVGDKIKITSGEDESTQEVSSMQVEHQQIEVGKKGDTVGLKVDQAVKPGAEVVKMA